MIIIGKLSKVALWMFSMPFCVEVVHVPSTSTAAKNTEKGMVGHIHRFRRGRVLVDPGDDNGYRQ